MRSTPILCLLALAALLLGGGGAAMAQPGYVQTDPYGRPVYRDPRAYPPGYYPGKLVRPAPRQVQPPPDQGFSLRRFFGGREEPQPARKPVAKPRRTAPAPVARQEKPKVDPSRHVVVFGDAFADSAAQGLDDAFLEDQDIGIVSKAKGDKGLASGDAADWPNAIKAALDEDRKIALAVIMLGAGDHRQSLKDVEKTVEPLTDRWRELYRQRVDAVLAAFQERRIPVVWVGLPPVKSSRMAEDFVALNEIYRESVERHGQAYVDVWPGFVDDENRYTATGPGVDGEPAKLRATDGVSFTKAGARKLAHFAEQEIKRILQNGQAGAPIAVAPGPDGGAPNGGASLEAALPVVPDEAAPVVLPVKPLAGPVLPLTRPDLAPGGTLISGTPKLNGDHAYPVQRALRGGIAPNARPGRADDFRWPRS